MVLYFIACFYKQTKYFFKKSDYFEFNNIKDTFLLKRRVKWHLQIFANSYANRV